MELRREHEKKLIGERANQLIAKRLKKQVLIQSEVWDKKVGQKNITNNQETHRISLQQKRRASLEPLSSKIFDKQEAIRDSLNEQLENYDSLQKLSQSSMYNRSRTIVPPQSSRPRCAGTYKDYFDPELQSQTSRQSLASSELSDLIPRHGYLGSYLSKKLGRYLAGSRENNLNDMEDEMLGVARK